MTKTLTAWLKDIGEEEVEVFIDGEPKMVSKTEALARKMYVMAQGGVWEMRVGGEIVEIIHKPDHRVAKSIREFTEGKAQLEPPKEEKKQVKPGQYNSEISRRLGERLFGGSVAKSKPKSKPKRLKALKIPNRESVSFQPKGTTE